MKRLCVDMTQNLMKKGSKCGTDITSKRAKNGLQRKHELIVWCREKIIRYPVRIVETSVSTVLI